MLAKALTHTVSPLMDRGFMVISGETDNHYFVDLDDNTPVCSCGFATKGGYLPAPQPAICSHTLAVINWALTEGSLQGYKAYFRQGQTQDWQHLHRKTISGLDDGVITLRLMQ